MPELIRRVLSTGMKLAAKMLWSRLCDDRDPDRPKPPPDDDRRRRRRRRPPERGPRS
jgi:hypothetical protein